MDRRLMNVQKGSFEMSPEHRIVMNRLIRELSEYTDDAARIISQKVNQSKKNKETSQEKQASDKEGLRRALRAMLPFADDTALLISRKIKPKKRSEDMISKRADVIVDSDGGKRYLYPSSMGDIVNIEKGTAPGQLRNRLNNYYKNNPPVSRDKVQKIYDYKAGEMKYGPTTRLRQDALMRSVITKSTQGKNNTMSTWNTAPKEQYTVSDIMPKIEALNARQPQPTAPATSRLRTIINKSLGALKPGGRKIPV